MKKIKEIYENRISTWAKYSGYRIIKRHGQDYIAPEENAVLMWYDPVEKEETLIASCRHCGKYFYREDVRSAYCSRRCRNQYHVYRSRKRKRLEENN